MTDNIKNRLHKAEREYAEAMYAYFVAHNFENCSSAGQYRFGRKQIGVICQSSVSIQF